MLAQKFYLAWELNPQDCSNNICFYYTFPNQELLKPVINALNKVIASNASLRQTFLRDADGGEPGPAQEFFTANTDQATQADRANFIATIAATLYI